jgi:uncharacterized RDD family membrane protein YckC
MNMTETNKTQEQKTELVYADFIKRTAAVFVDILFVVISSSILARIMFNLINPSDIYIGGYLGFRIYGHILVLSICSLLFTSIYVLIFEGKYQATLGKLLLGLKVVNAEGTPLSLKNKLFRFLFVIIFIISTLVPYILFLGELRPVTAYDSLVEGMNLVFYIIVLLCFISYLCLIFSPKKQTLYDRLTKTFVVENKKRSNIIAWIVFLILLLPILILFLQNLFLIFFWDKIYL